MQSFAQVGGRDAMRALPRQLPVVAAAFTVAVLAAGLSFAAAWATAPGVGDLASRVAQRERATGARPIPLSAVAPVMREAVVATEDERFWRHDGVDAIGILRAIPYDLGHLSLAQGASTIDEQLAKLLYLGGNDHNPWAKLRDAAIALRMDARYAKARILGDYLNTVYFGAGAYGVQAASRRYFGLPAARLSLAQASLLAGLIQAPGADDPYRHALAARERQAVALTSMVRNGFVTEGEARRALARPLPLARGKALPPLRGVSLDPGPPFYWGELGLGAALAALGALGIAAMRRAARPRRRLPRLAARAAPVIATATGLLLALGSVRGV